MAKTTSLLTAPVIDPEAVFTIEQATRTLGLAKNCVPREIRLRRLRAAKRAGRYFILGAWLLEWIRGGELPPRLRHEQTDVTAQNEVVSQ